MIFPTNVNGELKASRSLDANSRVKFVLTGILLGSVVFYFFLERIFRVYLGLGTAWAIVAQAVISVSVGTFIFRVFIFKEDTKLVEAREQDSDSFAKYLNMRKDVERIVEIKNEKFGILEYLNGTAFCVFCIHFGENNATKALNTKKVLGKILHLIRDCGYSYRVTVMRESFEQSREYAAYIQHLNSIENKRLSKHLMSIANCVLEKSEKESNVDCIYLQVESLDAIDSDEFITLYSSIQSIVAGDNAIRYCEFLDKGGVFEYLRRFYRLKAIDLAMSIKSNDNLVLENSKGAVALYQLTTDDDRVFNAFSLNEKYFSVEGRELR